MPNTKFSSTMRIDLTSDAEEGIEMDSSIPLQTSAKTPAPPPALSDPRGEAAGDLCEIVGSADFRELLQSVYDAAVITSTAGNVIRVNRRAEQFFNYNVARFCQLHITDLLAGSDESLIQTIGESLKDDRFILIQAYCMRSDRTTFPAEVSVNMLRISERDYISFFIRDVTLRREAEERLRTGHAAIQNSGNGIAVTGEDARLQYCNPAMRTLLGIDTGQKPSPQITAFLSNPRLADTIQDTVRRGETWRGELEMGCASGESLFLQASVAPNVDADGAVIGMVWSLLDVSDQKRIMHELIEHNAQLAEDLNLANEFQLAFIQRDYPVFPPEVDATASVLEFGHVYIPSGAVGGDFFEIFAVSESRVGIFISDVMGHGVRSALIVATIRGLIEELGPFRYDPAAFLSHMNSDLCRIVSNPGQTMFVTAFYMVLDLLSGNITYAGGGHPFPVLLKTHSHQAAFLQSSTASIDPALGLFPGTVYRQNISRIEPGDTIVFFTDGIVEAENGENDSFDNARLQASLSRHARLDVTGVLEALVQDVRTFCGRKRFDDDVCLVGMNLRRLLSTTGA
ncbi:MAG TPA: hypothetical protein DCS43_00020 [Verrucomicrobia bacterium]|nr:hypothetical protein [Verrucomicrobiota bacterium]